MNFDKMDASIVEVEKMVAEFESATTSSATPSSAGQQPTEIRNKTHWEKKVFAPFLTKMSKLKNKRRNSKSEKTTDKSSPAHTLEIQNESKNTSLTKTETIVEPQNQRQESEKVEVEEVEVEVIGPKIAQESEELEVIITPVKTGDSERPQQSKSSKITATEKGVLNAFRKCLRLPLNSDFAGKGERVLYAAAELELNNMNIDYYVHILKELQNLELMYELKLTLSILSQNQMKKLVKDELIIVPIAPTRTLLWITTPNSALSKDPR